MNKIACLSIFFVLFVCGCTPAPSLEFFSVVREHKTITNETCASLIEAIDEEIVQETINGTLTEQKKAALVNLRDRLIYMSESSTAIHQYIYSNFLDQESLIDLIKNYPRPGEQS